MTLAANSGDIWLPDTAAGDEIPTKPVAFNASDAVGTVTDPATAQPGETPAVEAAPVEQAPAITPQGNVTTEAVSCDENAAFERGRIAGLQEAILAIMSKNGSVTDQMRRDVEANVYHDSLINWVKSF